MSIHSITSPADFDAYLKSNQLLVAQFTASWCGPCRAITPVIDQLYLSDKCANIEFVRIDLDLQQQVLAAHSISSVPTFIFFSSGSPIDRVLGANARAINAALDKLVATPPAAHFGRHGNGADLSSAVSNKWLDAAPFIPLGYRIINDCIDFGRFEALNVLPQGAARDTFDVKCDELAVATDADSQAIAFVPFLNVAKVYSVLVRAPALADDNDLQQLPTRIKIWSNQPTSPLFESAVEDEHCLHQQKLDGPGPWYECRVKYVRFQNCQSITLFMEGADEDLPIVWDKILIVGVSGESSLVQTIPREA